MLFVVFVRIQPVETTVPSVRRPTYNGRDEEYTEASYDTINLNYEVLRKTDSGYLTPVETPPLPEPRPKSDEAGSSEITRNYYDNATVRQAVIYDDATNQLSHEKSVEVEELSSPYVEHSYLQLCRSDDSATVRKVSNYENIADEVSHDNSVSSDRRSISCDEHSCNL